MAGGRGLATCAGGAARYPAPVLRPARRVMAVSREEDAKPARSSSAARAGAMAVYAPCLRLQCQLSAASAARRAARVAVRIRRGSSRRRTTGGARVPSEWCVQPSERRLCVKHASPAGAASGGRVEGRAALALVHSPNLARAFGKAAQPTLQSLTLQYKCTLPRSEQRRAKCPPRQKESRIRSDRGSSTCAAARTTKRVSARST